MSRSHAPRPARPPSPGRRPNPRARPGASYAASAAEATLPPASAAASVHPGEVRSGGALDVRGPARLLIGRDHQTEITLAHGTGTPPTLTVSAGTLGPLVAGADGRLHAKYTPPPERWPRLVFVTARADEKGGRAAGAGWIAIALFGQPRVEIKSDPNTSVVVRVAGATFGPVKTDARGNATLTIVAPPGYANGEMFATDTVGNQKVSSVALATPPLRTVHALCPAAEGAWPKRFGAVIADASGRPAAGATPRLALSGGGSVIARELSPGWFEALVEEPDTAEANVTFTAARALTSDVDAGAIDRCSVALPAVAPVRLVVSVDRTTYLAGSRDPIRVRVLPVAAVSTPRLRHVAVELSSDVGTLSPATPAKDGAWESTWSLPDSFAGRAAAILTARAGGLAQRTELKLAPGPAHHIEFATPPAALRADGHSAVDLPIRAVDRFGNACPPEQLSARSKGALSISADGKALHYRAPLSEQPMIDAIVVRAGEDAGGEKSTPIRLTRARFGVGVRVGYVTNFGRISGAIAFVDGIYRLPWLGGSFGVGARTGVSTTQTAEPTNGAAEQLSLSITVLPVLAQLYYFAPVRRVAVYAAAGGGGAFSWLSASSPSAGPLSGRDSTAAASVLAGTALPLLGGRLGLEAGFLYAPISQPLIYGNLGGLHVTAGYAMHW